MGKVKGKNSRNTSKYDFYIQYTVTSDPKNLRYKVTVSAMLDIVRWRFDSGLPETVTISIDGSKDSKKYPNGMNNWGNNSSRVSKTMHTHTRYIPYEAKSQTLKLTAKTTDIESGGYGPGVCSASGTIKLAAKLSTAGKLTAGAATESSLKATLSGLPSKVGLERKLIWYCKLGTAKDYTKLKETTISATSKTTSFSVSKDGLLSSRPYNFKVTVKAGNKTITNKTATGTTAATTLKTTLAMGNTYGKLTATVKGNIGFAREMKWYYKRSSDKEYILSQTTKITASASTVNYSYTFSGLLSNVRYQFKVVLKTGNTLLKEIAVTGLTIQDESLVPLPVLYDVQQPPANKKVYVYWESPAHVNGASYTIQVQLSGESIWIDCNAIDTFEGGSIIQLPGGNARYAFRIKAVNSIAVGVERYSETITAYIYDQFAWDTQKVSGRPFLLTAIEWNRFLDWVRAVLEKRGITGPYELWDIVTGDAITAEQYNSAGADLNALGTNIPTVLPGDSITAVCLNLLRDGLNEVE